MAEIGKWAAVHILHKVKGYLTTAIILLIFWRNNLRGDFVKLGSGKCNISMRFSTVFYYNHHESGLCNNEMRYDSEIYKTFCMDL